MASSAQDSSSTLPRRIADAAMTGRAYAYQESERPTGESEVALVSEVAVRVRLLVNAVVDRLAFFAPCHGAFAVTGTIGFCLFKRAGLAPLIHTGSTGTRSRRVFRGWGVRASRDQGEAGNSGPIHAQASRDDCVLWPPAQCAGSNFTMNATGRHATCGTWNSFANACCRYKKGTNAMLHLQLQPKATDVIIRTDRLSTVRQTPKRRYCAAARSAWRLRAKNFGTQ